MYDLCIVGAGMIGSAASRHASLTSGLKTCLVGPTEPKKRSSAEQRDIFASHYDEGRITRCCDPDLVWATLAKESIKRYRDLESKSGITFYHEVGNLMIGGENSEYLKSIEEVSTQSEIATENLSNRSLCQRFPYLNVKENTNGILEIKNAGHINPRRMVEAQKNMAAKQECTIIDDVVRCVSRIVQSDGSYTMLVETEGGRSIESNKVLLTTGAFTNFRDLMAGNKPHQIITPRRTFLVEVDSVSRKALREMPCVIYKGPKNETWHVPPSHTANKQMHFYMLPPIKYPDGRYYIKLALYGGTYKPLKSSADVKKWFDLEGLNLDEETAKFTMSVFKDLKFNSWKDDTCVVTETPTTRPYIDMIHDQLGVAFGGNGYAAKSSDEIGRLAASMMLGKWDSRLPTDIFKFRPLPPSGEPNLTRGKAKL